MVDFFNQQVAPLAFVPRVTIAKDVPVDIQDTPATPITVWQKRAVRVDDEFMGENEDGYRWITVYNGISRSLNQKPF